MLNTETIYHIYNRGINSEALFKEPANFQYFLQKLEKYLAAVADLYAYCMMLDHFHLCIRTHDEEKILLDLAPGRKKDYSASWFISNRFASFYKCYAQAINKSFNRTGGLFEEPFRRIDIEEDDLCWLINHIHTNPKRHGVMETYPSYAYSSYNCLLSDEQTFLKRDAVIAAFGGLSNFVSFHQQPIPNDVFLRIAMD